MPAAIIGDAITVVSSAWNDLNGALALNSRIAVNTTINAAFLAGIVQTSPTNRYSGGIESCIRLLEEWNNRTLTYKGSLTVLYESTYATQKWNNTGTYYNPPIRQWKFDSNFLEPSRLPPGTPFVRVGVGN